VRTEQRQRRGPDRARQRFDGFTPYMRQTLQMARSRSLDGVAQAVGLGRFAESHALSLTLESVTLQLFTRTAIDVTLPSDDHETDEAGNCPSSKVH
jgi:hypothetical protein